MGFANRLRHKQLAAVLVLALVFAGLYLHTPGLRRRRSEQGTPAVGATAELRCRYIPGANDTLVVLKTGATQFSEKVPVHLETTFRCYPNHLIFADFEEEYHGTQVIDALASVENATKDSHPDFELYRRLRDHGRAALSDQDLSGAGSRAPDGGGSAEDPGWKLDKWKFLPMMEETWRRQPSLRWYVFLETDTFVFWATLLQYLATLDHTKPHYIGDQTQIGPQVFAHGGAGFVISNEGMRRVTEHYRKHQKEFEEFTDGHWAGDCVLGKALEEAGVPLTWGWPMFQGTNPAHVPYSRELYNRRLWCYPTISYHHLTPDIIEDIWDFGQHWLAESENNDPAFLSHQDVFAQYNLPRMHGPGHDWDNGSEDDQGLTQSIQECETKCSGIETCFQYSYAVETKQCRTSSVPMVGEAKQGVYSGWIFERVVRFPSTMSSCGDEGGWIYRDP